VKLLDIHKPFNAPVYQEETVTSTMEVSRLLARNSAPLGASPLGASPLGASPLGASPHGTVITADFQEAGRGRIPGRRWEMEREQALAFTVLLRFPDAIPSALTLRAGLAVAFAIEEFAPALSGKALIKWPNDILLPSTSDNKQSVLKAAGILAEAENGNVHIGIGVNVSKKQMPAFLSDKAISLSAAAGAVYNAGDRFILLEKILSHLHDEIEADCGKAANWRERLEARLYKKGEQICFAKGAADSGDLVSGTLAGIGVDGELLIAPDDGTGPLAFTAGEVFIK
jgi:BirA family biotin operon repressor/biotin-[acetyl-CoA-carboxylase] ligase